MTSSLWAKFAIHRVIPVIVVEQVEEGLKLAEILQKLNLPVAEITFRTKSAPLILAEMKNRCPELLIGAGTVLTSEQVELAKKAKADFIVSPGFNINTFKASQACNIPLIPGVNNPTSIEMALNEGLEYLKFFPAEASGGVKMIRSLLAPYQNIKFMPTGGIGVENVMDYLAIDRVDCCGMSWMVDSKLLAEQNWSEIEKRIQSIKELVLIK